MARNLNLVLSKFSLTEAEDELVWDIGLEVLSAANCYKKLLQFRLRFFSLGVFKFSWDKV